jgi:RimJ/RimL family protein N-acetyltransferase
MTPPREVHPWEQPPTGRLAAAVRSTAATLPRIETARLILRPPRIEDFQAYADIVLSDRWFDPGQTRLDAWLDFNQMVAGWLLGGTGLLSVDRREDGRLAGFVLVHHEYGDPECELGWFLSAEAEGRGYATEAARALRDHAERAFGLTALVSYVDEGNERSMRVAERLGARRDRAAEVAVGHAALAYRHPVPE